MSGSGWEVLLDGREALPNDWEALLDVRGSREALLDFWDWLGGPPGCPGVVGRPYRVFGSGREALPDVWE